VELDEKLTLAAPEGIDLDLVLAGIGSRAGALFLDTLVQMLATLILLWVAGMFVDAGVALAAVGLFMVVFGYPILSETFAKGQTLGKKALGIAVVRTDGSPVTFLAATIRNVMRLIDLLPGAYTVGLVAMLATKRCQRLGDLVAGTIVVRRGREQFHAGGALGFDPLWGQLPPEPPPEIATWDTSAVTAEEVAAIRAFLTRRLQLDPVHRHQLANSLAHQVLPKVAGIPMDGGPEALLERVAYARAFR
jgi:uncharacterized RDD family membrane protein YckC